MSYLQFFALIIFIPSGCPLSIQDVENDMPEPSDWDRFAAEEYETLVAEESAQAQFQEGWVNLPVSPSTFLAGVNIRNIKTTLKNHASNPVLFLPFWDIIKISVILNNFGCMIIFPSSLSLAFLTNFLKSLLMSHFL